MPSLVARLGLRSAVPGEYVVRANTVGSQIFFIQRGSLQVVVGEGLVVNVMHSGVCFGATPPSRRMLLKLGLSFVLVSHTTCCAKDLLRDPAPSGLRRAIERRIRREGGGGARRPARPVRL